jgi:alkylation response protein AidB-like acyl-CoA dehydrogenase
VFEPENAIVRMGSTEVVQHQFARSTTLIHSAREILMRGLGELDGIALERTPMPDHRQAYLRAEQSLINGMVREAVDKLITVLGNGVLSEADDIDMGWRDIGVITRHANVATNMGYQALGKIELAGEPIG